MTTPSIPDIRYVVVKYTKLMGVFIGVVSGMGRNKGTWDAEAKSRRTAQRWAAELRREDPEHDYRVEEST
jgi:hypothetical protein